MNEEIKPRKGRIGDLERVEMKESYDQGKSIAQIAVTFGRNVEAVERIFKKYYSVNTTDQDEAKYDLRKRPFWPTLKAQFKEEELMLLEYKWSEMVAQFKGDVLHTEEIQILDIIKYELLGDRCLTSIQSSQSQIDTYNQMIFDERSRDKDQQDTDYIINLERQRASLSAGLESRDREFRDLQEKKSKLLKDVKGTREQRIKRLEDSKESFTSWIATLMQDPDKLKQYGIEMEQMRMAVQKQKERLSDYHTYEDQTVDQPFLTPDTVK